MRNNKIIQLAKTIGISMVLVLTQVLLFAQERVTENTVTKAEVSSWFERNWMWVTGGVVLLLLIVIFSGSSSSRRRTTTIVKDDFGNTRSVSTSETID